MDNYPNNSNRFKEEQEQKKKKAEVAKTKENRKVQKVTTGKVRTKKRSKVLDNFISEDVTDVKDYIIQDILIPTFKNTLSQMVSNGIDMMLFGEVRGDKRSRGKTDRVSYREYYDRDRDRDERRSRSRNACDYDDIILDSKAEAEHVLDKMDELIGRYDHVTVADLYDLVGYDGGGYTANRYGWTSMRNADYTRLRDGGYLLKLPSAKPI